METLVRISKALEGGNNKPVFLEALLSELKGNVAKNGKPYVTGTLMDGNARLLMKHWDLTLDDFKKKYGITKEYTVVQIKGELEYYESQPQIIAKNVIICDREGALDLYCNTAPIPADQMKEALYLQIDKIKSPAIKQFTKSVVDQVSGYINYMPYSDEVHSEKAGWLAHVYNCLGFQAVGYGEPKKKVFEEKEVEGARVQIPTYKSMLDKDIIISAIIVYNTNSFFLIDADQDTGIIKSKSVTKTALFGSCSGIIGSNNITNIQGVLDQHSHGVSEQTMRQVTNLEHCINVLNNLCKPCTPEAYYLKHLINLELLTNKSAYETENIGCDEKLSFVLNGERHCVVRIQ